jgi:hypothetical protein
MEKIIVLNGRNEDENLVNCLKMLFPDCIVEVHKRKPIKRDKGALLSMDTVTEVVTEDAGKHQANQ